MKLENQFGLNGKVIVITGGAGLLGKEFVKAITENGGIAIIADKDEKLGNDAKIFLSKKLNSSNIDFIKLDITSKESLQNCTDYLNNKYKRIDALINNAYPKNKNFGNDFFDISFDDFVENIGLHLGGYFITSQNFALYFKKQGYGNIINISSIYGVISPKFEIYKNTSLTMPVEYAAIKSSLIHLTKYMAKYFKGMNIRVNCISPGGIFNHQPESFLEKYKENCLSAGMLKKNDLNGSLFYLLSDMSKYVNGQNIIVDDGFSL
jgi:NAD(P)-dependent dehydrogenase (short-subunit alcohol dehydrogenase family)